MMVWNDCSLVSSASMRLNCLFTLCEEKQWLFIGECERSIDWVYCGGALMRVLDQLVRQVPVTIG